MTKHAHEHCTHVSLKFCEHCDVTYCLDCKKEWGVGLTYTPFATTTITCDVPDDHHAPPGPTDHNANFTWIYPCAHA